MADAISIEETNKVRVALGLKPLPVPGGSALVFKESHSSSDSDSEEELGSTLESRQAEGYDNWRKHQEEAQAKKKREERNAAIRKARDTAQKFSKLEGKGLGEEDENTKLDTRSWLLQQKKRQKKVEKAREQARKMEEELRLREQSEYTSKDLAGVKVAHEMGDFDAAEGEQVLTLKDTTIDENEEEGDELENAELKEKEMREERLELKKKKPVYDPNAMNDDESGEKVILQQYDEVIDGKKRKRFTLDGEGVSTDQREARRAAVGERINAQAVSLDILKELPISDYQEPSEVKIKKPKKKKAKHTRQKNFDDEDSMPFPETNGGGHGAGDSMEIDSVTTTSNARREPTFADDEDLQASLSRQRREALKKRKKTRPEDIAMDLRREESATPGPDSTDVPEGVGLIIDETSEFVNNLQKPEPRIVKSEPKIKVDGEKPIKAEPPDSDSDVDMDQSYNNIRDERDPARQEASEEVQEITETGLDEEATLTRGIGSALNLLTQRGILKQSDDSVDKNTRFRDHQRFLAEKHKREAAAEQRAREQRERDRKSGKLDRMSVREREEYARRENRQRDHAESWQTTEIFNREYKPDIQLKYTDEFGRSMNPKEAFKHLSHQFHGKGSGKQKTEKRLKRIEEEKKKEAQSALDSGQGTAMNNALGATAKKNRQAGVRLG